MAQNATIVVANHAAANKNFTVEDPGIVPGYKTWAEKTAGVNAQYIRLTLKTSLASSNRPTNRQDFSTVLPVVRSINGVSTVVGYIRMTTQMVDPVDATTAEIQDAYAYHKNGMSNALLQGQLRDRDFIS